MAAKSNTRWTLVKDFRPSGHAWFYDNATDAVMAGDGLTCWWSHMVAVADTSGMYPDETKDGVLYLDPLGHLDHDGTGWCIHLVSPSGERCHTFGTQAEAFFLRYHFGLKTS